MSVVLTGKYVAAFEQVGRSSYHRHIFRDDLHRRAWQQVYRGRTLYATGRGWLLGVIDHRNEIDFDVDDREDALRDAESEGAM